ncbi:MAG: hypothetical protein QME49_06730, partial [bacterium]|nr:hypothetical protein [bacterium]
MEKYQNLKSAGNIAISTILFVMLTAPGVLADMDRHKIIASGNYTNPSLTEYTMTATGQEYYTHCNLADEDGKVDDISGNAVRLNGADVYYYFQVPDGMLDNELIEQLQVKITYDNTSYASVNGGSNNEPPRFDCYNLGRKVYYKWGEMEITGDGSNRTIAITSIGIYPSEDYYINPFDKQIRIKISAPDGSGPAPGDDDATIDINQISVILKLQRLEIISSTGGFNFGNIYLNTNASTRIYNESQKKTFQFKNIGSPDNGMGWKISADQSWIRFSKSSGWLMGQDTEMVEVWLQPSVSPGTYIGTVNFISGDNNINIPVSANAYYPTQPIHVSPQKGLNNRVNIVSGSNLQLQVASQCPFNPNAQFGKYLWKKVSGSMNDTTLDNLKPEDFEQTSVAVKDYFSLSPAGTYTVYCETYETIGSQKIESDPLAIPVRVCSQPILHIDLPDGTRLESTQTTTDATWCLCLKGYDGEIENVPGTWTVTGGIGTLSSTHGTFTYFNLTTPGIGSIIATDGIYTTTVPITVKLGALNRLTIEYSNGTEVKSPQI